MDLDETYILPMGHGTSGNLDPDDSLAFADRAKNNICANI